jgi:site-specific recombinase
VLLFASSLIAGWVENWFVFHRLDSAIAWNPRSIAWLGESRAQRWARWWRDNISGLAANVSLGLMLGLVPALASVFGLPLEVRHVTLSTGQIAAALGTLGLPLLHEPAFWWCVAAIPVTAMLNLGVSFALAFRLAMVSQGLKLQDRGRIYQACASAGARRPAASSSRRGGDNPGAFTPLPAGPGARHRRGARRAAAPRTSSTTP